MARGFGFGFFFWPIQFAEAQIKYIFPLLCEKIFFQSESTKFDFFTEFVVV